MNSQATTVSVLAPVDIKRFFDTYWEQTVLHISAQADNNRSADYFSSLVSAESIERLLSTQKLSYPDVQLSNAAGRVDSREYTDEQRHVVMPRLLEHHGAGATIVISQAQDLLPELANFCRAVQQEFQLQCQTNIYLSPPGEQGFRIHYDTHDVFILQVSGSKAFSFYEGGATLPFSDETFSSSECEPGAKTQEITLTAGDTLYIPRGALHDAKAVDGEPSLHITLGVYAVSLLDVISGMSRIKAAESADFRQSIARTDWLQEGQGSTFNDVKALLNSLSDEALYQEALSQIHDEHAFAAKPSLSGLLSKPTVGSQREPELDLSAEVVVKHVNIINSHTLAGRYKLRAAGRVLEFEGAMATAVEALINGQVSTLDELSLPTREQKIALGQRLISENLIALVIS